MINATEPVRRLLDRGVRLPAPEQVWIADEIVPGRIAPDVTIHPGCRLSGAATSIGPRSELGREAAVTLNSSQLGSDVQVHGGWVSEATLLDGATLGSGAHIRPGTLLEEQVRCGHTVGLKQTLLMPYVTTGSLVNLCDCLMAGGSAPHHHSEVGSSFVHFNYTPQGDKATPSLIGDVPRGVMLHEEPIFLGGQGGLVGPRTVAYGTITAAGTILRHDILSENQLMAGGAPPAARPHTPGAYRSIRRMVTCNLAYIGNLHALQAWYDQVRALFMNADGYAKACLAGAQQRIHHMIEQRIAHLDEFAQRLPRSLELAAEAGTTAEACDEQHAFYEAWPRIAERLQSPPDSDAGSLERDRLLGSIDVEEPD
ncbi:MAG: hypothetical protein O3A51_09830, partial [Verrucomicrobia bacterium]|nr:hypothetical protein [Verrucomicrobiota bacterium]